MDVNNVEIAVLTGDKKLPKDVYEKVKQAEKRDMQWYIDEIKKSDMPEAMYRDRRAICDLRDALETSCEMYGDKVQFHQMMPGESHYTEITYREANEDIKAIGTSLCKLGLQGKHIGVVGNNCYEWAESYFAVIAGTGVVIPLDKELNEEELTQLSAEGELSAVICTAKHYEIFKRIKESGRTQIQYVIGITPAKRNDSFINNMAHEDEEKGYLSWNLLREQGRMLIAEGNRDFLDAQILNDKLAAIIFTSGTTGHSKGVMLSHKNLCSNVMIAPVYLRVNPEDIFFSILPIHHTYECTCTMIEGMYCGASMAFCRGLKYITKDMQEVKPTMVLAVPLIYEKFYNTILKTLRKQGKEKLVNMVFKINNVTSKIGIRPSKLLAKKIMANFGGRIRVFIAGGAKMNPDVLEFFKQMDVISLQGYGLSETSPMVALNPDKWKFMNSEAAGKVLMFTDCKIVDEDENGNGEICFKGPQVMLGYYKNPEATAEVLRDGWFHTGDIGYLDKKNYIYITGRKKNVIITANGKNVFPEELEEYLLKSRFISECMIWGEEENEGSHKRGIYATVRIDEENVLEELGENCTEEQIEALINSEIDAINSKQPLFKRVNQVIIRKREFNKTTAMKIRRFVDENKRGE